MIQEAKSDSFYIYVVLFFIVLIFVILFVIGYALSKKFIPKNEKITHYDLKNKTNVVTGNVSNVTIKNKVDSEIKKTINTTTTEIIPKPIPEIIKVENQLTSNKIGYEPSNLFIQNEPFTYPYVLMPKPGCHITLPKDGGSFRRGFTEDKFYKILESYFNSIVEYSNYKILFPIGNRFGYEPDIAIIDSKNNLNLFIDVEIDEPYEGLNDIRNRKPTHCVGEDSFRNNDFTENGWIVIRFAEIQIHQTPIACCQFIAQVIVSVNPNFTFHLNSYNQESLKTVKQWSITTAKIWSGNKYREEYLGIHSFGSYEVEGIMHVQDVDDIIKIAPKVKEPLTESISPPEEKPKRIFDNKTNKLNTYISFQYYDSQKLIKVIDDQTPSYIDGYCYVLNKNVRFEFAAMENIESHSQYYTTKIINRNNNLEEIKECINKAIARKSTIRIVYAKQERHYINVDEETGEIFQNHVEAEVNLRSVSEINLAINVLSSNEINNFNFNENYVTGYCHLRNEQRTFKIQRIEEIEVLKI
jgi:hypothetical protein